MPAQTFQVGPGLAEGTQVSSVKRYLSLLQVAEVEEEVVRLRAQQERVAQEEARMGAREGMDQVRSQGVGEAASQQEERLGPSMAK